MTDCMACGQVLEGPYATAAINRCRNCYLIDGDFSVDMWQRILAAPDRAAAYARELDQRRRPRPAADPGAGFPPVAITPCPPHLTEYQWFCQVLTEHFLPTNDRALLQWKALAKRYGKATSYTEAAACIAWCHEAAAMKGTRIGFAEHAVNFAQRWATLRMAGSSIASSSRTPVSPSAVTPRLGSPTIATSPISTPSPELTTSSLDTPCF